MRQEIIVFFGVGSSIVQTPQPDCFLIMLAGQVCQLISGLAEFVQKLQNSAENMTEHYKFS